jgi:hypothetical protein
MDCWTVPATVVRRVYHAATAPHAQVALPSAPLAAHPVTGVPHAAHRAVPHRAALSHHAVRPPGPQVAAAPRIVCRSAKGLVAALSKAATVAAVSGAVLATPRPLPSPPPAQTDGAAIQAATSLLRAQQGNVSLLTAALSCDTLRRRQASTAELALAGCLETNAASTSPPTTTPSTTTTPTTTTPPATPNDPTTPGTTTPPITNSVTTPPTTTTPTTTTPPTLMNPLILIPTGASPSYSAW